MPSLIDLPVPFVRDIPIRGSGRYVHFLSAWICVITGLIYAPKSPTYATFAEPEHTLLGVHHFERGAWLVHGYSLCEIYARHSDPRCRTDISSSTV